MQPCQLWHGACCNLEIYMISVVVAVEHIMVVVVATTATTFINNDISEELFRYI